MATGSSGSDKAADQPNRTEASHHADAPELNHSQLITELYNDFGRIDRQKSGAITIDDVNGFLGRPHLSEGQLEMGHFVKDNFDELAKMGGVPGQIRQSNVDDLKEVFAENNEAAPDASIVARSTVGGAIGGGAVAYGQDRSVRSGASKGAAVGATIGLIAYGVEAVHYNNLQKNRALAEGLHYPTTRYTDASKLTDDEIFKLADKPVPLDTASALVEKFRGTLSKIDFNNDGVVTADELKEAIRSNYIPDDQKPLAAALAKDMSEVVQLNDDRTDKGLTDSGLHRLAMALQTDNHGALHEARLNRFLLTGAGTAGGALWGGVIGAIIGNVPGAAVGAAIGSSLTGGGTYYFKNKEVARVAEEQTRLRTDVLKQTVQDLHYLPKKLDDT